MANGLTLEQINEVRAALAKVRTGPPADGIIDAPEGLTRRPLFAPKASPPPQEPAPFIVHDDRRRNQRVRQHCNAEISPWINNRAGASFGVEVENLSTTGVGVIRTDSRLQLGSKYLLEIARPNQNPLAVVFTAVRCDETVGGRFNVELAPDEVLDIVVQTYELEQAAARKRVMRMRAVAVVVAFTAAVAAAFFNLI